MNNFSIEELKEKLKQECLQTESLLRQIIKLNKELKERTAKLISLKKEIIIKKATM